MVHPGAIPTYRGELLRTTALTPTQHKSGFKSIIGIVAAIAIAVVAPEISAAIGLSGAIGATAGGALVGAGLGGLSSFALGGNPLLGAIGGAVGGGIAGFNAGGIGAGADAASATSQVSGDLTGNVLGNTATDFSSAGGYGLTSAEEAAPGFAADLNGVAPLDLPGYAPADFGATLSGGATAGGAGASISNLGLDGAGNVTGATPGLDTNYQSLAQPDQATGAAPTDVGGTAVFDPNFAATNGQTLANQQPLFDYNGGTGSIAQQAGADPAFQPKPNLLERTFSPGSNSTAGLSGTDGAAKPSFWQGVEDTATSPKFLTQTGLQLGANVIPSMILRNGDMSDYEKKLLERQDAATARQNAQVDEANAFKKSSAEDLRRQALYYDPNYTGTQDYAAALNRRKRQEFDALSNVSADAPQARAGLKRRYDLDTARSSTSAFDSGYQRGAGEQTRLTQAASSLYPAADSSYASTLSGLQSSADKYYARLKAEQEGLGGTIGGIGKELGAGGLEAIG